MSGGNKDYQGAEHRSRQISENEVRIIAEAAAEVSIAKLFEVFGVDVTTQDGRKSLQDDFTFLRDARTGTASVRKAGVFAIIGTLVTAILLATWKGMTMLAAMAAKVG